MQDKPIGVGVIGMRPNGWAAMAHLPALRAQPENFRLVGLANSSAESGRKAAEAFGLDRGFAGPEELIASDEVDVVTVTVKLPQHHDLVASALKAGKHVFCEWPLSMGLARSTELAEMARGKSLRAVIGTQARVAPAFLYMRDLIADGYVGEVLSSTLIGSGGAWGAGIDEANSYILDVSNGVTMMSIPFGHTMAAIEDVLGPVATVSAEWLSRRKSSRIMGTGEERPMTSPDQLLMAGVLESGAPLSAHYRGGVQRGIGLRWEINGSQGDLVLTGPSGQGQMGGHSIAGGRGEASILEPLPIPASYDPYPSLGDPPKNVAILYARMAADIRQGTATAPTFDEALRTHRLLDAIERAAREGVRVALRDL